jgi:hypothetical protein
MTDASPSPGPIAKRTFSRGLRAAVLGGVACVGLLYWSGVLSISSAVHTTATLALFPVYVLAVAVVLGVWLGFDTDRGDLERVTVDPESDNP